MQSNQQPKLDGRKISPRGMIDLPYQARLALDFVKDQPQLLNIDVQKESVRLSPAAEKADGTVKASPRGLLRLSHEAHAALSNGSKGNYSMDIDANGKIVRLYPAQP